MVIATRFIGLDDLRLAAAAAAANSDYDDGANDVS